MCSNLPDIPWWSGGIYCRRPAVFRSFQDDLSFPPRRSTSHVLGVFYIVFESVSEIRTATDYIGREGTRIFIKKTHVGNESASQPTNKNGTYIGSQLTGKHDARLRKRLLLETWFAQSSLIVDKYLKYVYTKLYIRRSVAVSGSAVTGRGGYQNKIQH